MPSTNGWAPGTAMTIPRERHSATRLPSGKVLVAGGLSTASVSLASAELYDPVADSWSPTGPLPAALGVNAAALLANGRVLVVGDAVMGYDPATNAWIAMPGLPLPRGGAAATALAGCAVLAVGGILPLPIGSVGNVETYESRTNAWTTVSVLPAGRSLTTVLRLADGDALIAGGLESITLGFRWLPESYRYTPPASFSCVPLAGPTEVPVGRPVALFALLVAVGLVAATALRRRR